MLYGLVHIEMLYHMDSASFLAAFDRFCRDRRVPSRVKCDNGTNFVCARQEGLKRYVVIWQSKLRGKAQTYDYLGFFTTLFTTPKWVGGKNSWISKNSSENNISHKK
jgi:hypothetical protein